jgi:hypothetical protein
MTRFAPLLCLTVLAVVGCGSPEVKPLDEETMASVRHFQKIGAAYNRAYQAKGKPPSSAKDLKPYLKDVGGGGKDALLSPNDGKPIVIVPGVAMDATPAEGERSIVAYEQTGVNGKRMMVDIRGMVHFVTDKEFATIKFVGGHKPK